MKKLLYFIPVLCVLALGITVFFNLKSKETIYNTYYVNGNTAGNLYNAGMFCENNGVVFFANPDDHNALYAMDIDGSNLKKLSNDSATYINADSNYVYYIKNTQTSSTEYAIDALYSFDKNVLCRIDRDGKNKITLDDAPCLYASLIGNYIYYLHYDKENASTLYKIGIDGENQKQLTKDKMFTCSSSGQYFFYNNMTTNGNLYRFDTATDTTALVWECNSYKPIVSADGDAYYLDVNANNALVHANINSGDSTYVTFDSIDLYNICGSYIFYQKYDQNGGALCMIKTDGSDGKELIRGDYCCINVTSTSIYFTDYRTGQVMYTPTQNPGELYSFHPGIVK